MPARNSLITNMARGAQQRLRGLFHNTYRRVNVSSTYLKYLKNLPPGKMHCHKLFGNPTWFTNGAEYLHGLKEIFIDEVYKQQLPEKAHILDCGAHIGLSVIYLKKLCPTATITAFEPDEKNFLLLEKNIGSHHLENVELRNEAVWTQDTTLDFQSSGSMSSRLVQRETQVHSSRVKAVRLKNYLQGKVHFLKMDIEGAEFEVVRDMEDRLSQVENLFVEYHGSFEQSNQLTQLFAIFTRAGFDYYLREALEIYRSPFLRDKSPEVPYDIQLNIFCSRRPSHSS